MFSFGVGMVLCCVGRCGMELVCCVVFVFDWQLHCHAIVFCKTACCLACIIYYVRALSHACIICVVFYVCGFVQNTFYVLIFDASFFCATPRVGFCAFSFCFIYPM